MIDPWPDMIDKITFSFAGYAETFKNKIMIIMKGLDNPF